MIDRKPVSIVDLVELIAFTEGVEGLARLVSEVETDPGAVLARFCADGPVLVPDEWLNGE
jgi:hypothetical protein